MALKSILEVELDDSQFQAFKKLFDKYQDQLKKLPKDWADMAAGAKGVRLSMEAMTDEAKAQNKEAQNQVANNKQVGAVARTTAIVWATISREVTNVASRINDATGSLVKWGTLTAAFTGLLGAGSLFGIDRLAASVATSRRSAMGLGVGYGQQASFNANYSRLINPSSLLSNVMEAKYDYTSPAYTSLLAAGVSPQSIKNGNAATISAELLSPGGPLERMFVNTPKGIWGIKAHTYGIDQVMPMNDIIAFLNADPEERRNIAERAMRDAETMDLTEAAQRKWQDFTTQMGRASGQIESSIMEKFARIEPGLEKLSAAFTDAVKAFLDSDVLKQWIDGISDGLETFASYIGTKDFQDDVTNFASWIGQAAKSIWDFILSFRQQTGMGLISPANASETVGQTNSVPYSGPPMTIGPHGLGTGSGAPVQVPMLDAPALAAAQASGNFPDTQSGHAAYIQWRAAQLGVDPNVAMQIANHEGLRALSAANPNSASAVDRNPDGTSFSFGDFQENVRNGLGTEARRAGIDPANPSDWMRTDDFALSYMHDHGYAPWGGNSQSPPGYVRNPSVTIRSNTGNNPVISNSLIANPYTAVAQ